MINKTIHYVWLGKKQMPKSYILSRESATKFADDFEIKLWTEEQLPEFNLPPYFYKLMKEKRYALASDIYRIYILNKYGGIYFDTDQVLVVHIDDLLDNEMIISRYHEVNDYYGFGLVGIVAGHEFLDKMIDFYNNMEQYKYIIINKIGSEIINQMLCTEGELKDGVKIVKTNESTNKINGIKIFDQEYFYPLSKDDYTKNTRSYHLANTSWVPWYRKVLYKVPFYTQIKNFVKAILPYNIKKKLFRTEYL